MEWQILYFSEQLQREIMGFPAGIQARFIHLTERIMTFGPNLGMPHSRAIGRGLFELRMKSKEGIGRVFYCILPNHRVMMLHCFVKKSSKTPSKELKIAQARAKELASDADAQADGQNDAQGSGRQRAV
jgi:phage-related protein